MSRRRRAASFFRRRGLDDSARRAAPRRAFRLAAAAVGSLALALAADAAPLDPNHVFVPCVQAPEIDRISLAGDVTAFPFALSSFRSVAIDSSGIVYLADYFLNVYAMDQGGSFLGKIPLPLTAMTIAFDRDDALWAALSSGTGAVMKFSKDGSTEFELRGLALPSGLAIDGSNRAWVADVGTDRLLRISTDGVIERVVAVESCPREVAVDRAGNVWVGAQCPQPRLFKFDSDGAPVGNWPVPGTILGSLVADREGAVWVSTPLTNSIHRFSPEGALRASYGGIASATSISIDGEGMLWITGDNASVVTRFDPRAGAVIDVVRTGASPRGRGDMTGLTRAMIVDPTGDVDGDRHPNAREIDLGSNPFSARSVPFMWLAGNVNLGAGNPQDVLFVNDSAGHPERVVELASWEPIVVFMDAPALSLGPAPFALYAMPGLAVEGTEPIEQPFGIGVSAFPTPLSGGEPQPLVLANGFRSRQAPAAGLPRFEDAMAPKIVRAFPRGFGRPFRVVLQGLVADPGSAGPGISVTNAVGVIVR